MSWRKEDDAHFFQYVVRSWSSAFNGFLLTWKLESKRSARLENKVAYTKRWIFYSSSLQGNERNIGNPPKWCWVLQKAAKKKKNPKEIKTLKISWYTDLPQELGISDSHFLNFLLVQLLTTIGSWEFPLRGKRPILGKWDYRWLYWLCLDVRKAFCTKVCSYSFKMDV